MKYFNKYISYVNEYYQEPEQSADNAQETTPPEQSEQTSDSETDTETKVTVEKENFSEKFSDSFGYNKIQIDEKLYAKNLKAVTLNLDSFIDKNKQEDGSNPIIKEVNIIAQGSASWVNTKYKGDSFSYDNNIPLATDRGDALSKRVTQDVKTHLESKSYDVDTIKFNSDKKTGIVKNKESKLVLNNFIKDNFETDKIGLTRWLADKAGSKKKEVKFFKDDGEDIKTRPDYEEAEQYYENITLEDANAERIYELLSTSPAYVTYTAQLKKGENEIRRKYRDVQTANVTVEINAHEPVPVPIVEPETEEKETVKPEAEEKEVAQQEEIKISLQSIPFKKDTSQMESTNQYNILLELANDYENKKIEHVVLVGHAESDDELTNKPFNPNSNSKMKNKASGNETIYTERMLADLRFLLAWERIKAVVLKLSKDAPEFLKWAIKNKKIVGYSVGSTYYGNLANPRIVQVMVQANGQALDSEPQLNLFKNGYKGNGANKGQMSLLKALNYNIPVFYNTYVAGDKIYNTKISPTYIEMANPKTKEEALKYSAFRNKF